MNVVALALSDADAVLGQPVLLGSCFCFGTLLMPICTAVSDSPSKSSDWVQLCPYRVTRRTPELMRSPP
jgi:hypothetical protein